MYIYIYVCIRIRICNTHVCMFIFMHTMRIVRTRMSMENFIMKAHFCLPQPAAILRKVHGARNDFFSFKLYRFCVYRKHGNSGG